MARYNVNEMWDDPFEPRANRRAAPRFELKVRLSITVEDKLQRRRLIGPGVVRNISTTGAYLITKHRLAPGQRILIAIPTVDRPADLFLPEAFIGPADVIRVEPDENNRMMAALRFGEELVHNMEFAVFMSHLQALHGSTHATPAPRMARPGVSLSSSPHQ